MDEKCIAYTTLISLDAQALYIAKVVALIVGDSARKSLFGLE